jgi:hypothetical protein
MQVNNFLFIFSLEVGGKFCGWFGIITNMIILPLAITGLIAVCIDKELHFIRDKLDEMEIDVLASADETAISQLRDYLIFTLILVIIMSAINLIASGMLLRGTKTVRLKVFARMDELTVFSF